MPDRFSLGWYLQLGLKVPAYLMLAADCPLPFPCFSLLEEWEVGVRIFFPFYAQEVFDEMCE
jgi:hypothetical protein